jgi:uncharacterized protein YutE (UPF0331/DUF86 family)
MARNLEDLGAIADLTLEEFTDDRFRQKGTERILQEVIEAAVDVNLHLLRVLHHSTATDYFTSFVRLADAGVLTRDLAEKLAPAAGLKNRLVHEYDDIDDAIILAAVTEAREFFSMTSARWRISWRRSHDAASSREARQSMAPVWCSGWIHGSVETVLDHALNTTATGCPAEESKGGMSLPLGRWMR